MALIGTCVSRVCHVSRRRYVTLIPKKPKDALTAIFLAGQWLFKLRHIAQLLSLGLPLQNLGRNDFFLYHDLRFVLTSKLVTTD